VRYGFFGAGRGGPRPHSSAGAAIHEKSPLADLNEGLRNHDPRALVFIQQRVTPQADAPRAALSDEEAGAWLETLLGLRSGFVSFNGAARAMAVAIAC